MELNLEGQAAIVTGASRGIGRAIAVKLAEQGANVVVHGTNIALLEEVAEAVRAHGTGAEVIAGDVTDPAIAQAAIDRADAAFGGADILVNNAGINTRAATLDMPLDDWHRVMDVNLNGTLYFCRAALPGMIARGYGRIVNVTSTRAKTPHLNAAPAYGASKAAVNYLTMHLAQEMAGKGIRVNAVCPGPVETDMSAQWTEEYRAKISSSIPIGRLGTAPEIADIVVFLASDMSGFVTGETINANGGTYMN